MTKKYESLKQRRALYAGRNGGVYVKIGKRYYHVSRK